MYLPVGPAWTYCLPLSIGCSVLPAHAPTTPQALLVLPLNVYYPFLWLQALLHKALVQCEGIIVPSKASVTEQLIAAYSEAEQGKPSLAQQLHDTGRCAGLRMLGAPASRCSSRK